MPWNKELFETLSVRERFRDNYWRTKDPILAERLLWRINVFRHLVHLLPQESILEFGAGDGLFTEVIHTATHGRNPLTSASFSEDTEKTKPAPAGVERINLRATPEALNGRTFNFIIVMDLLDGRTAGETLSLIYDLLAPGGEVVFSESNPWNLMLRFRRLLSRVIKRRDPRTLMNRSSLYELLSEIGFIRIFAVFVDFMYAPLTKGIIQRLQGISVILENFPVVRTYAGAILIHAQKPPRQIKRPVTSLADIPQLNHAVSFVIPCHNEEMNIPPLIKGILDLYGDYVHEIVLVDDNSRDGTRQVIEAAARENPRVKGVYRTPPNGVGRAISDGMKAATGPWVLSLDCDFQHLLPELSDLFAAAGEGYDVVLGSRFSPNSVLLNYPFAKIMANRGFIGLARLVFFRRFRDVTNNLKLLKREVVENLRLRQAGFSVNAETGLQPLLMNYSIKEVPISWINRTPDMGSSSFRLAKVGGGYLNVLWNLLAWKLFGTGLYHDLPRRKPPASTG
jgi:SAM-dependent methyltransferase